MVQSRWSIAPAFVLFATAAVAATPSSLSFAYTIGGAIPPPQSLSLTGTGVYSANAASVGSWLAVRSLTGPVPGALDVVTNPQGLSAGTYTGAVLLSYQNAASQTVPVTLVVTAGTLAPPGNFTDALTVSPSSLTFSYQPGGANPPGQALTVTGSVPPVVVLIAPSASAWLTTSPLNPASSTTLTIFVNPAGLAAGTYSGAVIVSSNGEAQNVTVTLTVSGGTAPAPLRLTSIVNAASFLASPLAPGEIISIFGSALGPETPATRRLTPFNVVDTALAGTRVIIDGKPAPILFTQSDQVNTIVPYSVAGRTTVLLQLEYQGVRTTEATLSVADAAPAIFTLDGTGRGQAAILNQDTSVNFDLNPASRGTVAVLYATGAGVMAPAMQDGAIAGAALSRPVLAVSVLVDGQEAQVTYAGSAPGQVAGALQVNFRVPPQSRTGAAVGLLLKVGRSTSQPGVTISIR